MTSICLCMIVRDEAAVIERCLRSVRGLIQTWVICDTGSTDQTSELDRKSARGIPGELHQCHWVNFGHNRTELMERAYGKADYLLLIDADMTITYEQTQIRTITADSYLLDTKRTRVLGETSGAGRPAVAVRGRNTRVHQPLTGRSGPRSSTGSRSASPRDGGNPPCEVRARSCIAIEASSSADPDDARCGVLPCPDVP